MINRQSTLCPTKGLNRLQDAYHAAIAVFGANSICSVLVDSLQYTLTILLVATRVVGTGTVRDEQKSSDSLQWTF